MQTLPIQLPTIPQTWFKFGSKVNALFWTFFYNQLLHRNTIKPLKAIIQQVGNDRTNAPTTTRLLEQWARSKADESKYIQLAGGFLFTTVATSLAWPGTGRGHWSAPALFYSSILLSLVAIFSGSQQQLVLPLPSEVTDDADTARRHENSIATKKLLTKVDDGNRLTLKNRFVFMLQVPIMLLTFSVMTFVAGLCSVVVSPVVRDGQWNDDAKIAVVFVIVGVLGLFVFVFTSNLIHALFKATPESNHSMTETPSHSATETTSHSATETPSHSATEAVPATEEIWP